MSSFNGCFVAIAPTSEAYEPTWFMGQLMDALLKAGVDVRRNDGAVSIHIGPAKGVIARFTTGNRDGEQFATTLAKALRADGIEAAAVGGLMEDSVQKLTTDPAYHGAYTRETFKWVVIGVGEKP